jgi:hypothetical protein
MDMGRLNISFPALDTKPYPSPQSVKEEKCVEQPAYWFSLAQ